MTTRQLNSNTYQAVPDVESEGIVDIDSDLHVNKEKESKFKSFIWTVGIGIFIAVVVVYGFTNYGGNNSVIGTFNSSTSMPDGEFDDQNRYVMKDFDKLRPMSNFLNGMGGLWGIPMWAFYVNRGQGITSFGKQNKDSAMLKFVTAEKAYQQTPFTGFRTFVKGTRGRMQQFTHMPFFPRSSEEKKTLHRNMKIGLNEMEIEEIAEEIALKTNVLYYIAPEQDFPALVRSTTFTNMDSTYELKLEILDGLAKIIPNGLGNNAMDTMGRTSEAWMNVYNVGETQSDSTDITQPFFHISQEASDVPQVRLIKDGYFSIAYVDTVHTPNKAATDKAAADETDIENEKAESRTLLKVIVDPDVIFETDTSLTNPSGFFKQDMTADKIVTLSQGTTSRTPCSFAGLSITLPPGATVTITSVYGYAENVETFVGKYAPMLLRPDYSVTKRTRARTFVEEIIQRVATNTVSTTLNSYISQNYLDNLLRGGFPMLLGGNTATGTAGTAPQSSSSSSSSSAKVFHVYSRIHGDIERDYNYFQIDTTYFSQGPGNFRDVCQNRRLDVFHSPFVKDFNIRLFLSFLQSDGYNPLTIASTIFRVSTESMETVLASLQIVETDGSTTKKELVRGILSKAFRPGQFFRDVKASDITFGIPREEVLNRIITFAKQEFAGQFAQNGYWVDHWTYILDLFDNFLSIYPDAKEHLLWDSEPVTFFLSPAVVKTRLNRYMIVDNPEHPGTSIVRVYNAISNTGDLDYPAARQNALNTIYNDPNYVVDSNNAGPTWQRDVNGSVFRVSVMSKLVFLGMIKFATMDPYGMGIEMEGGKPGWNDAMNGLPGLLGSGMSETYEMLRVIQFVHQALTQYPKRTVRVAEEFADFVQVLDIALDTFSASSQDGNAEFVYWDTVNTAREAYRARVVGTFTGHTVSLSSTYLLSLCTKIEHKVQQGIARALRTTANGLSPTYFYYDCTQYDMSPGDAAHPSPKITPKSFQQRTLPLFLEGPTRHLKVLTDPTARREVYTKVKSSTLYDAALKMFTLSESLATMGQDVGRMKAFSPGWLENQSVWLHMSYKFYVELLRAGLYEEFFTEMSTGVVPFMNHTIYGRSPLEAASFLVSSAFPDKHLHGQSFLARLSGSTAEFLSIWAHMMAGPTPFRLSSDISSDSTSSLELFFQPILPSHFFDPDTKTITFTFLGEVTVSYVNPTLANTWTLTATKAEVIGKNGQVLFQGASNGVFKASIAHAVRDLQVKSITITY